MEMPAGQEQTPQVEARKTPLWEDVVDVFASPAELFRRRAQDSWVKPWLTLSIISAVLYYVFLPATKALSAAAMQAEMTKRGMTEMPAAAQKFAGAAQLAGGIIVPIALLVSVLLIGLVIWILGAIAKGGPTFKQGALIVAWASFVGILQQVLMGVLILIKTNSGQELVASKDTSFGILRFLDPGSIPDAVTPLLGRFDVFAIWTALLWLVGLKVICRWSTEKAGLVAVLTWLAVALPGTIWAFVKPG